MPDATSLKSASSSYRNSGNSVGTRSLYRNAPFWVRSHEDGLDPSSCRSTANLLALPLISENPDADLALVNKPRGIKSTC